MKVSWLTLMVILTTQQLVCAATSNQIFCSVVCSKNSCNNNDPTPNGCTACNTNWVPSGVSTCIPSAANNYYYFDKSNDLGGTLVVQSYSSTLSQCSYNIYGLENAANTITVKSATGIPQIFSQMIVYFGIFTVDVGVNSNSKWNYNNAYFFLEFKSGDNQTFNNSYRVMGDTYITKNNLCSISNTT